MPTGTKPATISLISGLAPLYCTACIGNPPRSRSSSMVRCEAVPLPSVPYTWYLGSFLARAISSCRLLAGTSGLAMMAFG